jgi:hypothetical protein
VDELVAAEVDADVVEAVEEDEVAGLQAAGPDLGERRQIAPV